MQPGDLPRTRLAHGPRSPGVKETAVNSYWTMHCPPAVFRLPPNCKASSACRAVVDADVVEDRRDQPPEIAGEAYAARVSRFMGSPRVAIDQRTIRMDTVRWFGLFGRGGCPPLFRIQSGSP